jgi:hypothetical protein
VTLDPLGDVDAGTEEVVDAGVELVNIGLATEPEAAVDDELLG